MTFVVQFLRALLRYVAIALVVPLLLFEEWGWEPLAALVARLARLPLWAALEDRLRRLPPWGALLAFFVPVVALLPVKVLALFLFGRGHAAEQEPWFARWYPRWKAWKDHVLGIVRQSRPWRLVRAVNRRIGRGWRRLREG
jgi:hypothetical protein